MKNNKQRVKEVEIIKDLDRKIRRLIDSYLEKNYTEKEIIEGLLNHGENIGFFKKGRT